VNQLLLTARLRLLAEYRLALAVARALDEAYDTGYRAGIDTARSRPPLVEDCPWSLIGYP
jgi:hypothetical protein